MCFPSTPVLQGLASQHASYTDPGEGFNFEKRTLEYFTPLKVSGRGKGLRLWGPGALGPLDPRALGSWGPRVLGPWGHGVLGP